LNELAPEEEKGEKKKKRGGRRAHRALKYFKKSGQDLCESVKEGGLRKKKKKGREKGERGKRNGCFDAFHNNISRRRIPGNDSSRVEEGKEKKGRKKKRERVEKNFPVSAV